MNKIKLHLYGRYMGDLKSLLSILSEDQEFEVTYDFYNTGKKKMPTYDPDFVITENMDPPYTKAKNIHIGHGAGCVAKLYHFNKNDFIKDYGKYYALAFYGDLDKNLHVEMGFPKDKVIAFGMPVSIDLLKPIVKEHKEDFLLSKGLDVTKQTILYAPTWNQSSERGLFPLWFREEKNLLEQLCIHIKNQGLNFIIRMHERHRYSADWLSVYKNILSKHNVHAIYANEDPDNIPYLRYTDYLIGDMSSMNTYFYVMNKPVIHIGSNIMSHKRKQGQGGWSLEDRAGIIVDKFEDLLTGITSIITNDTYSEERKRVVKKYISAIGDEAKILIKQEIKRICS